MMFVLIPNGPIILSPMFSDKATAIAIFKEWISLVGKVDDGDRINEKREVLDITLKAPGPQAILLTTSAFDEIYK